MKKKKGGPSLLSAIAGVTVTLRIIVLDPCPTDAQLAWTRTHDASVFKSRENGGPTAAVLGLNQRETLGNNIFIRE